MTAQGQSSRGWLPQYRLPLLVADSVLWAVGLSLATWGRYDFGWARVDIGRLIGAIGVAVALNLACGLVSGLHLGRRRLGSFEEALSLATCSLLTTVTLTGILLFQSGLRLVPLSAALAGGAYQLIMALALRYVLRSVRRPRPTTRRDRGHRTLVFGAGEAGLAIAKALLIDDHSDLLPVALLDDDPAKAYLRAHGLAVLGGKDDIAAAAREHDADTILIAIPSAPPEARAAVADRAAQAGLAVKILPSARQRVWDGPRAVGGIRPFTVADYLGRPEVHIDLEQVAGFVTGRRVLVTGAGGFIGGALCERLARLGPRRLVMLDHDENGLHGLRLRLSQVGGDGVHETVLADIRDRDAVWAQFAKWTPDVVFHAAAHKHVDVLERFPMEAYLTNVVGTDNVLAAAAAVGTDRFINISTDKAANPVGVLGASKRIGEMLTAHYARVTGRRFMSVRFGNVLGSTGSVMHVFRHQIETGQPITVTHPEVSRYFMTPDEAVRLVMQAAAVGGGGEVLVLDMGEPVRLVDLAHQLAAELRPGHEPEIVFIGLRPGEKLNETLEAEADELLDQPHERVARHRVPELDPADLEGFADDLDAERAARRLLHLAGEVRPRTPETSA